jgi:hypothetical protein
MFGFTVIKNVQPAELATVLKAIVAPDGLVVPTLAEDGSFDINLANELIDHAYARQTFKDTEVPVYRQSFVAPVTRTRRSRAEIDAATADVTLPTVSKRGRGKMEPITEEAAA